MNKEAKLLMKCFQIVFSNMKKKFYTKPSGVYSKDANIQIE